MAPRVEFFDGAVTVIRPLVYLSDKELACHAQASGFPADVPCPQGLISRRAQVKAFLRQLDPEQKQIRTNLWRVARQAMEF